MTHIEQRLTRLESKLRFYQFALIAILLTGGFFILTSFNKQNAVNDLVQAKEFQVLDSYNKVILSLKKDSSGGGRINVYDNIGTNVLYLHAGYKGGRIVLSDHKGMSGMVAAITEDNHGVLNVYNSSDKRICAVGGDADGNGVVNVYNNAGEKMNGVWPKE